MSDTWNDLTTAFQRGDEAGLDALSDFELDLYWIQFFILDFEMGGWKYNWTGEWERFQTVAAAMRRRGLTELAELVAGVENILRRTDTVEPHRLEHMTWNEVLHLIDPDDDLEKLDQRIMALQDYGIPSSWDETS